MRNQIELKNYSDSLEEMVAEKTAEATSTLDNTLQAIANIIEYRNLESGSHVKRTQFFCKALVDFLIESNSVYAAELRASEPDIIIKAMALHDVGKIGIPDKILLKPGRLDPGEYEVMKTHTIVGKNIIEEMMRAVIDKDSTYLRHCLDIAYCHHERYDGKGYPQSLAGDKIPLAARLASLADVYDALCSKRVYKDPWTEEDVLEELKKLGGSKFDPELIDIFFEILPSIKQIQSLYPESSH